MCGIFLSSKPPGSYAVARLLLRRGPDFYVELNAGAAHALSSVLSIRGCAIQPVRGKNFLLQYNGEIFDESELSDTEVVAQMVEQALEEYKYKLETIRSFEAARREEELHDSSDAVFSRISKSMPEEFDSFQDIERARKFFVHFRKGESCDYRLDERNVNTLFDILEHLYLEVSEYENELALCFVTDNRAFFFKDDIGRRSLGISREPFAISSVLYEEELDPLKLYIYDFESRSLLSRFKPRNSYTKRLYHQAAGLLLAAQAEKRHGESLSFLVGYEALLASNWGNSERADAAEGDPTTMQTLQQDFGCLSVSDSSSKSAGGETSEATTECRMTVPALREACIERFKRLFLRAVRIRLHSSTHVVFFSGGIDSSLIALFVHLSAPAEDKIYLINTALPKGPDRISGRKSYAALVKRFPERKFVLVENDSTGEKVEEAKEQVKMLVKPKATAMHTYIAIAQHLTAKKASIFGKTALVGSGADEMFCGYRKDDRRVDREAMLYDIATISSHNLCRDDRAIGDCGVEARFPFLDSKLMELALSLPDALLIDSEGNNKALLRAVLLSFGLDVIAAEPKRAIHFGTHISHQQEKEKNG